MDYIIIGTKLAPSKQLFTKNLLGKGEISAIDVHVRS